MNPVRWVKEDHPKAGYQTLYSGWFVDQQARWNVRANYFQKFNMYDYIGVQVFLGGLYKEAYLGTVIEIINCREEVKATIYPFSYSELPGNVKVYNSTPYQLGTLNWIFNFAGNIVEEGVYFLRLKVRYLVDSDEFFDYHVSEPISVKFSHEDTRIIEYASYSNKLGVHYTTPMYFHLRMEAEVVLGEVKAQLSQYDDQLMHPRQQNAVPYRVNTLKMGYPGGLPMWMYDKINRAFSNDLIILDKVRYFRDNGAEIEIGTRVPRYQKYPATLKIREYDESEQNSSSGLGPLALWDAYSGSSYCLYEGKMKNSANNYIVSFFSGYEINSIAEEDDFIANVLNVFSVANAGLTGEYKRIGSSVCYINGPGENFDTDMSVVFTKHIRMGYSKLPTAQINPSIWIYTDRCAVKFKHNYEIFIGGSGTVGNFQMFHPSYNYGSDTSATIRIWHDDGIQNLYLQPSGTGTNLNTNPLTVIAQNIPTQLLNLVIQYPVLNTGLDFTPFPATMERIEVTYGSVLFNTVSGFNKNWVNLLTVDFSNNFFSASMVDSIYNQHYNANGYTTPTGGVFRINTVNGTSAPTAASLTARNKLAANSWTDIHD